MRTVGPFDFVSLYPEYTVREYMTIVHIASNQPHSGALAAAPPISFRIPFEFRASKETKKMETPKTAGISTVLFSGRLLWKSLQGLVLVRKRERPREKEKREKQPRPNGERRRETPSGEIPAAGENEETDISADNQSRG